jgi:tetratricopeptide (TPR) repeat protein
MMLIVLLGMSVFCFGQQVTGDSLVKMLEQAKTYYNSGDYERAVVALENALRYLKQLNRMDQVEAYKYLAFSYVAQGEKEKAKEQFKNALALDPNLELDPATVSPKIIKVFEEVKSEMAAKAPVKPPVKPPPSAAGQKSPSFLTTTLHCCVPGLGQSYRGQRSKGKTMLISTLVLIPAGIVASIVQENKHQAYLGIDPIDTDEMDQAYKEYRIWYNVSAYSWIALGALYLYNIYDLIMSKPAGRTSMLELDRGFYCEADTDKIRFGYNVKY